MRLPYLRNYLAENAGAVGRLVTQLGYISFDTTRIYSQPTIELLASRVKQLS